MNFEFKKKKSFIFFRKWWKISIEFPQKSKSESPFKCSLKKLKLLEGYFNITIIFFKLMDYYSFYYYLMFFNFFHHFFFQQDFPSRSVYDAFMKPIVGSKKETFKWSSPDLVALKT